MGFWVFHTCHIFWLTELGPGMNSGPCATLSSGTRSGVAVAGCALGGDSAWMCFTPAELSDLRYSFGNSTLLFGSGWPDK